MPQGRGQWQAWDRWPTFLARDENPAGFWIVGCFHTGIVLMALVAAVAS